MATDATRPNPPPARRTQQQRRAETEAKLIDATIRSLIDLGYYRTTIKEICSRADVSQGGLFGRFDTRLDIIVAAAAEIGRRQAAELRERLNDRDVDPGSDAIEAVVLALADVTLQPANAVWIELLGAARTDDDLRKKLVPVLLPSYRAVLDIVHDSGLVPGLTRDELDRRLLRLLNALHGEAVAMAVVGYDADADFIEFQSRLLGADSSVL